MNLNKFFETGETSRPVRLRASYRKSLETFATQDLKEASFANICDKIFAAVGEHVPTDWFRLAAKVSSSDILPSAVQFFKNAGEALAFATSHTTYIIKLIEEVFTGDDSLPAGAHADSFSKLTSMLSAPADLQILQKFDILALQHKDGDQYMSVWRQVLDALAAGTTVGAICAKITGDIMGIGRSETPATPSVAAATTPNAAAANSKCISMYDIITYCIDDDLLSGIPLPVEPGLDNDDLPVLSLDKDQFTMSNFAMIFKQIEADIWAKAFGHESMMTYKHLEADMTNPRQPSLRANEGIGQFRLPFAGSVTLNRKPDSFAILIMSIIGGSTSVKVYLDTSQCRSVSSNYVVPACLVRTAAGNNAIATCHQVRENLNIRCEIPATDDGGDAEELEFAISCPYLVDNEAALEMTSSFELLKPKPQPQVATKATKGAAKAKATPVPVRISSLDFVMFGYEAMQKQKHCGEQNAGKKANPANPGAKAASSKHAAHLLK